MHFPISVAAGGSVVITVDRTGRHQRRPRRPVPGRRRDAAAAATATAAAADAVDQPGVQGDWVGVYGVDGYVLGGWNGTHATWPSCRPA